jgi:NAD(P)-dependent dehydrogenase (short-subunit alcohol dehydrogenase family)
MLRCAVDVGDGQSAPSSLAAGTAELALIADAGEAWRRSTVGRVPRRQMLPRMRPPRPAASILSDQRLDFRELTAQQFEDFWRVGCFDGFMVGREAARRLVPLRRSTVIFTGASASIRGKPGFAHFSAAKAGLRMISQSKAREYGPLGIHVAHVVVDGGIDGDRLRSRGAAAVRDRLASAIVPAAARVAHHRHDIVMALLVDTAPWKGCRRRAHAWRRRGRLTLGQVNYVE